MFKYALLIALVSFAICEERTPKTQYVDPFAVIDKHLSHSLAYHYLWPWSQLIRAAAALDLEESLEDPKIISTPEKYQVNLNVRRFKPDELKIKVKNRYIIVEGKHKEKEGEKKFMANHFVQRFVLPLGTEQEEVTAVLNEKGVLSITAPKHELPPPPPERDVPIEVRLPEEKTESPFITTEQEIVKETENSSSESPTTSSYQSLFDLLEPNRSGRIRKKELKTTTNTTKDNEVNKEADKQGNGLDYALIEPEE